jgi:hypothetical protein
MRLILSLYLILFSSLPTLAQSRSQQREYISILSLYASAKSLAREDLRCHSSNDCQVLPLGAMACGGPQDFLIASTHNQNLEEIKFLAHRTEVREHQYNLDWQVVSVCVMRMPPVASCINRYCR